MFLTPRSDARPSTLPFPRPLYGSVAPGYRSFRKSTLRARLWPGQHFTFRRPIGQQASGQGTRDYTRTLAQIALQKSEFRCGLRGAGPEPPNHAQRTTCSRRAHNEKGPNPQSGYGPLELGGESLLRPQRPVKACLRTYMSRAGTAHARSDPCNADRNLSGTRFPGSRTADLCQTDS